VRARSSRSVWRRTRGIAATRIGSRSPTLRTAAGETGRSFINGRAEIIVFLTRKWAKELDYRLIKEIWTFGENRIAVRFAYEWHDDSGNWFRSYGNENWEFNAAGEMQRRLASINDLPISEADRKYRWPLGRRPDDHSGLSDLGL
jgi:nuclear transport factor 2 (NTF2) superfamily protein